jgi:hypothetical protein
LIFAGPARARLSDLRAGRARAARDPRGSRTGRPPWALREREMGGVREREREREMGAIGWGEGEEWREGEGEEKWGRGGGRGGEWVATQACDESGVPSPLPPSASPPSGEHGSRGGHTRGFPHSSGI